MNNNILDEKLEKNKNFGNPNLKGVYLSNSGGSHPQSNFLKQDLMIKPLRKLGRANFRLNLSKIAVFDEGFIEAHIEGKRRIGKSVYGMLNLYELYQGDWDEVFKNVAFSLRDFITLLKEIKKTHIRRPAIMFDDAGVGASAAVYNIDQVLYVYFKGLMDTIGTLTKCLITTSPDFNLMKPLRGADRIQLRVKMGRHRYDRIVYAYQMGKSPLDQKYASPIFKDQFDVRLPIYDRYFEAREKLSLSALDDIDTYLNSIKDKTGGEHIDIEGTSITRKEYDKHRKRDVRAGISHIRMKDWGVKYASKPESEVDS